MKKKLVILCFCAFLLHSSDKDQKTSSAQPQVPNVSIAEFERSRAGHPNQRLLDVPFSDVTHLLPTKQRYYRISINDQEAPFLEYYDSQRKTRVRYIREIQQYKAVYNDPQSVTTLYGDMAKKAFRSLQDDYHKQEAFRDYSATGTLSKPQPLHAIGTAAALAHAEATKPVETASSQPTTTNVPATVQPPSTE